MLSRLMASIEGSSKATLIWRKILDSSNISVRRLYVSVLEKVTMAKCYQVGKRILIQTKHQVSAESFSVIDVFGFVVDSVLYLVKHNERDPLMLSQVTEILLSLACIPAAEKKSYETESSYTCRSSGLLTGHLLVRSDLIALIPINSLKYVYGALSAITHSSVRAVILHWIINACKMASSTDEIGGMAFFKDCALEQDPLIAHISCEYLVQQLSTEKLTQYQALVKKISLKLGVTEDAFLRNRKFQSTPSNSLTFHSLHASTGNNGTLEKMKSWFIRYLSQYLPKCQKRHSP